MQTRPLIAELESTLRSGTDARRSAILTAITNLFVGGAPNYSEEQIGLFDDVMVRLVRTIDAKARANLARRLAPIANAPATVLHKLAFDDDIEVARPILSRSDGLEDSALLANAKTKGQQHLLALAQRQSLSEALTDVLIERGDREVTRSVVNNAGSRFSEAGFRRLVERSASDADLAAEIGLRSHIPRLHFTGSSGEASTATETRSAPDSSPPRAANEDAAAAAHTIHFAAVEGGGQNPGRVDRIGEAELYQYARARKFEETARGLSLLCDTPLDIVERALLDPTAEIVLILARVAGLSAATTKAMLLLRAADRGMSATDIDHALSNFERLQSKTARRVLNFFRTRMKAPTPPMISPAAVVHS